VNEEGKKYLNAVYIHERKYRWIYVSDMYTYIGVCELPSEGIVAESLLL